MRSKLLCPTNEDFRSLIILHLVIVLSLCEYEASYRTLRSEGAPSLFSCIFKHACTRTHTYCERQLGSWSRDKNESRARKLIVSQAGQLQSGAREAPPCLQRSKASFSKALFAFCSVQQLNSTQRSLFLPVPLSIAF